MKIKKMYVAIVVPVGADLNDESLFKPRYVFDDFLKFVDFTRMTIENGYECYCKKIESDEELDE